MILIGRYPSIKLKSEYSLFIKFEKFDMSLVDKVKSFPIRQYIPEDKVWEVPISSINRVVRSFGVENIKAFTEFPEYEQYLSEVEAKKKGKKSIEELKEYYRTLKCEVDYKFKTAPQGHQIESFNYAIHNNSLFITDVMGLGKTKQALDIMDYKKEQGLAKHCLIICGLNSLKYNWLDEIKKHSWNNAQVIEGTKKKRKEKLEQSWQFYYSIINVEMLRDDEIFEIIEEKVKSGFFTGIIADEVHKMTNHKCKQGENFGTLKSAKYKLALTGTPITKRIEKMWNLLTWMGIIEEGYWGFVKRYCVLGGFSGYQPTGQYKNLEELHEIVDKYQIRRTKDILNLPPKVYQTIYVEMNKDQLSEYNQIKRGIIRDIESGNTKNINPAVATIKLRQFTDAVKQDAIKKLIEELYENNNSAVVFSKYKDGLYALHESLKETYNPFIMTGNIKDTGIRQEMVNNFQNSTNAETIMGTIDTMGTGYTLTKSNYVIFLNKDWVVGNNQQAEDRCHRIGTVDTVTVISVIVKDSVDERVEEILENDQFYIDQVIDGVVRFKSNKDLLSKLLDLEVA